MNEPFIYFLGLFDTSISKFDGITTHHPPTNKSSSGINEYFPLFENNFVRRGNWYKVDYSRFPNLTFSITNSSKVMRDSRIHFRILIDGEHVISNKSAFYSFFKDEEFTPKFYPFILGALPSTSFEDGDVVIVKPDKGCLGIGVEICYYSEVEKLTLHPRYREWTISKLYYPRLFNNRVITNRLYFLVIKEDDRVSSFLYDEFVNYIAIEELEHSPKDFERFKYRFISNYSPIGYTEADFYRNRYVSMINYVSLFTREEFSTVFSKIKESLSTITKKIAPLLLSTSKTRVFHIYGVDTIITDDLDLKILEINGAPSIADRSYIYPETQCTNYYQLINALMKVVVDPLYPPMRRVDYRVKQFGKFKDSTIVERIFTNSFIPLISIPLDPPPKKFYIARPIYEKYPFIRNAFFNSHRKMFYQRTKNPYDKIEVFYGMRDLYVNPFTSPNYYNEVVEFNRSECTRKAKIVNKIQGVTYFLANKQRLYLLLGDVPYHPPSIIFDITEEGWCTPPMIEGVKRLNSFLSTFPVIVKPSDGSQGKGITVITSPDVYKVVSAMMKTKEEFNYSNFIISKYISNPLLYKKEGDIVGRKINIRFYVLLYLSDKLQVYLLNKKIIYFSLLEYFGERTEFELEDETKLRSLTNLQFVTTTNKKYGTNFQIKDFVLDFDKALLPKEELIEQFLIMCRETIMCTHKQFRSINRFIGGKSFNLVAYDTLPDDEGKLHLIEINRGADLVGLHTEIGDDLTTKIFEEMFDIVVDGRKQTKYFEKVRLG